LLIAGIIQDERYFETEVKPHLDGGRVQYIGSVGPDRRDNLLGGAECLLHPIGLMSRRFVRCRGQRRHTGIAFSRVPCRKS
jgi:hypothetical protein